MAAPDSSSEPSAAQTAKEIKLLLQHLRKSSKQRKRGNYSSASDREDALHLDKLRRIFAGLIDRHELDISNRNNTDESASAKWNRWLLTQHDVFIDHLVDGILAGKTASLRTFCGVIATTPVKIDLSSAKGDSGDDGKDGDIKKNVMLSEQLLNKLLCALLKSKKYSDLNKSGEDSNGVDNLNELISEESMLSLFESEFLRQYRDAQYFVMKGINKIAMDLRASMDGEKKKPKEEDTDESENDSEADHHKGMGIVAENMCRLLIMMDYVARNASDLNDDAKYLFDPPLLTDDDTEDEDDNHDEGEDANSDEDDTDSDSDSDESVEESEGAGRKRAAPSKGKSGNKRSRKTKVISWQQSYKHRFALQQAWLSTLRLPHIPTRTQKHILQHLSSYVLGVCPSPLRFAEYFTRSFQAGTSKVTTTSGSGNSNLTSILALDGLFILMLDHQLEYPEFYSSLYQLLHPRILYTKQRGRFLQLLSKSLMGNSMLPAYVVASYCKKLCRLALSGPPSGGLFALALVSNLLRKHGECACLIHRSGKREDVGLIDDVFVEDVDDLTQTRALESSLWELTALEKHYHHAISTVAKAVGTEDDKTTPMYDMDDFMAHTYKSLFEQEKKRLNGGAAGDAKAGKKKGGRVSLTFVEPEALFTKEDVFGDFFKCNLDYDTKGRGEKQQEDENLRNNKY